MPSVLFSVPKKIFRRAHDRNLLKRRMRESYRTRKGVLVEAATERGLRIEIALICSPETPKNALRLQSEIPDFKTIDNAIERILEQIVERY